MNIEERTTPWRHFVIQDIVPPDLIAAARSSVPSADDRHWVRYNNDHEQKWAYENYLTMPQYWKQLMVALTAPHVTKRLGELIGEPGLQPDGGWRGGGLHLMFGGGRLACHLDAALHPSGLERRANLILYLDTVRATHGGGLVLGDSDGKGAVLHPEAGQAVAWECGDHTFHEVLPLHKDAPPRLSAAAYFLSPPRPNATRRRALFCPVR